MNNEINNLNVKIRKIFNKIYENIDNDQILLLIWARQVWKTTLMKQIQQKVKKDYKTYFLNLEDFEIKNYLNTHPNKLFEITWSKTNEKQIIFIDEIQYLDNPTNFLKYIYDEYKENIKLVVSGSSSFYIDQKFRDSLIWRKKIFNIYTLDFEEFLDFKNELKLKEIYKNNETIPLLYKSQFERLFLEYITYWWYPEIVQIKNHEDKIERLASFTQDYIKKDIYDSNIADSQKFLAILKTLASQTWELLNMNEIANTFYLSLPTIEKYIYIMQKSFHIAIIRPFYKNVKKELTKMPKIYFYDLGFRNSLLKNFDNINLRSDKWNFLENIYFREFLFKYNLENINFWRTQNKNEVDFIIEEKKAYEIKFNEKLIKPSKYELFRKNYPDFDLEFLTFNDLLKIF